MIYEVMSALITPKRNKNAIDLWNRWVKCIRKLPGVEDTFVLTRLHGNINDIRLVTKLSSLSVWEEFEEKKNQDPELQALYKEHEEKEYTVMGTMQRTFYKVAE